jgi:signal peptide peptidase SppA
MAKFGKRGLMAQVLSRMATSESLISDRHTDMLVGLLVEAERVEDPQQAWTAVRQELCETWSIEDGPEESRKPFIYRDGIAVIPIHGILLNRFVHCWGFVTGYDFIRRQKNLAEADPDVKAIVYDIDSPGGEAAGCDEIAREIVAGRAVKQSIAVVNTLAASGAYWLAAAASRIICAPSGSVGSIGVYIQHMNIAKLLAEFGVDIEFIKAGKFKTSGNMFEPLGKQDRAYLQDMVDERYDEFVAAVAEFRGIEETIARSTEARVMRPKEALTLGLIDAAVSPADAVADFVAELGRDEPSEESEEDVMADEITTEQRTEIENATRARIKGIMTSEEAQGREKQAEHLAYETDLTVEAAVAILATGPKAEDPKPGEGEGEGEGSGGDQGGQGGGDGGGEGDGEGEGSGGDQGGQGGEQGRGKSQFEQAMDGGRHPEVGADGEGGEGGEGQSKVAQILSAHALATGRRYDDKSKAA